MWVYSFSSSKVLKRANAMIDFYNAERIRCFQELKKRSVSAEKKNTVDYLTNLRSNDVTKISWSRGLFNIFCKNEEILHTIETRPVLYRPFCKKELVYNRKIIETPSKWNSVFPDVKTKNFVISISGVPSKSRFSAFMIDTIQDFNNMGRSQCFPLYIYEEVEGQLALNAEDDIPPEYTRKEAITDAALQEFRKVYGDEVSKENIFYYIYAVLQSKGYISAYQDNLSKEMPRIPFLKGFSEYVRTGKELAELHLHYEQPVDPSEIGLIVEIDKPDYTVQQMKFLKDGKKALKDTIIFNEHIRISHIPARVYDYIINGKSAVEWLMERYAVTTDKASGITDNPNDYGDEKYIFNLLISVMAVSLKTLELIDSMPEYTEI